MIFIEKDTVNKVILTLWESLTMTDPFYAFKFTNNTTREEVIFLATDTSTAEARYNLFDIEEGSSPVDPLNGMVSLNPSGQWKGEIYETETESLDPDDWGSLLQIEMVIVSGDELEVNPIYR